MAERSPSIWPDRYSRQQCGNHHCRTGRDADPRRLRAGDGRQFLGRAEPDAGGATRDAGAGLGRIVNITSIGGKIAVPHLLPYTCAKFAAVGFSEGLRAELADTGINVTTVVPGLMRTGSHLHAEFGGEQGAEYRWFALNASAPTRSRLAPTARRDSLCGRSSGARPNALIRSQWSLVLAGFSPATTNALTLVDRFLPQPPCAAGRALAARGRPQLATPPRGNGAGSGRGQGVQAGPTGTVSAFSLSWLC